MLAALFVFIACESEGLAQAIAPTVTFAGTVSIPVDLKNLHPDVDTVIVLCNMTQTGTTQSLTRVAWPGLQTGAGYQNVLSLPAYYQAIHAKVSSGAVQTTVISHFAASRPGIFAPGEVWGYSCQLKFIGRVGSNSGHIEVTPGVGPTFTGMAQLTSGNTSVQGTFTLQ